MVLDFYYFSYQCPLNDNMIRLLNEYRDKIDINLYDISNNHLLAGEMKMFFPTCMIQEIRDLIFDFFRIRILCCDHNFRCFFSNFFQDLKPRSFTCI